MGGRARAALLVLALGLAIATPAVAADDEGALDRFNRANQRFNHWLLLHVVRPVAQGYNFVVPKLGQQGIENFLLNLERPRDMINSLLQGKPVRAGRHLAAFLINTVGGLGGFLYISDRVLDDDSPETFNETLGVYGVPPGSFLILPILGETSPRHLVGLVGDTALNPLFWIPGTAGTAASGGAFVLRGVNTVASYMPSPFADRAAWEAFERQISEMTPYPEAKELFFENQRFDVED